MPADLPAGGLRLSAGGPVMSADAGGGRAVEPAGSHSQKAPEKRAATGGGNRGIRDWSSRGCGTGSLGGGVGNGLDSEKSQVDSVFARLTKDRLHRRRKT